MSGFLSVWYFFAANPQARDDPEKLLVGDFICSHCAMPRAIVDQRSIAPQCGNSEYRNS
jgi:hypothetical protein